MRVQTLLIPQCLFFQKQLTRAFDFVRASAPDDLPSLQFHLKCFPFWSLGFLGVKQSHHRAHFQAPVEVNHFGFTLDAGSIGENRRHGSASFSSPPTSSANARELRGGGNFANKKKPLLL